MKKRTKVQLTIKENNLERLNNYLTQNNLRFAPLVRDLIEKYFNKKGLK